MANIETFLNEINSQPIVYSKKTLSNKTIENVFDYQKKHILKLVYLLLKYYIAFDFSDTGIGKTFIAIAVCLELGRRPIIICPKTVMFTWLDVCKKFRVKPYDIVNYETIRNGKTYKDYQFTKRIKSPFIDISDDGTGKIIYKWTLPKDSILIFDEAHRCKSPKTDNGKILISTKMLIKKIPILLASASICEKWVDMRILFYLLEIIPSIPRYNKYVKMLTYKYPSYRIRKSNYENINDYTIARENSISMMINMEIKMYASRIRIKDLGDQFPSNQWCAEQYYVESSEQISKAYEEIVIHIEALRNKKTEHHLASIQKLKQEIELRKVPIFIEQAKLYLDNGMSVIIFVNYLDTMKILINKLKINCSIHGSQTMYERKTEIEKFQSNLVNIIICQINSGGTGISLHDLHGDHPRAVLLNYPDSASTLLQALGRACRAKGKTPVLQRIICVANVEYEKQIMININRKLANISAINDGDLDGYNYDVNTII